MHQRVRTEGDKLASYSSIPYNMFCSLLIFLGNGDCLDNDNDSHDPTQLVIGLIEWIGFKKQQNLPGKLPTPMKSRSHGYVYTNGHQSNFGSQLHRLHFQKLQILFDIIFIFIFMLFHDASQLPISSHLCRSLHYEAILSITFLSKASQGLITIFWVWSDCPKWWT